MTENKYVEMAREITRKINSEKSVWMGLSAWNMLDEMIATALESVAREASAQVPEPVKEKWLLEKQLSEKEAEIGALKKACKQAHQNTIDRDREIEVLEKRESNYLETIGQDTRTIKGLRLEVAVLEQKLEKAVKALRSLADIKKSLPDFNTDDGDIDPIENVAKETLKQIGESDERD